MNFIVIVGRLVRDPEYTPRSGDKSQYAKFTVAVDNDYGDLSSFFDCIAFGVQADHINNFLSKGRLVAVKGRHEQGESYTDKHGSKRRSWTLRAERVKFLDRPAEMDKPAAEPVPYDSWEAQEEDVPF